MVLGVFGRRCWLIGLAAVFTLAACGGGRTSPPTSASGQKLAVVVAESFWGSIAAQLGGDRVAVTSIITSPDADPHDYEPTPGDSRAIAAARYVIFNGVGYDPWAAQAVDASPSDDRRALEIGKLLGLHEGDNPHRWYFPPDVERVIGQITDDYKRLDPASASYFDEQRTAFETDGLRQYKDLLAQIKKRFAGTPVGASESIFEGIAEATGLDLRTPSGFLTAISEGTDPTAQDKATVDQQIGGHQIKVFVYNSQNATPDVSALVNAAHGAGIPVAKVTETPETGVRFQDWQSQQLQGLLDALEQAARS